MIKKHVRDVMLPLDDVPAVSQDAVLADAANTLARARARRPGGRLPCRAVLVVDDAGRVVGKIGHLGFLRALAEHREAPTDLAALDRACVDPELIESISDHQRLLEESFPQSCARAAYVRVRDAMLAVEDSVEEDSELLPAVHTLVRLGTLSILVRRGTQIVGLLRLADLFDLIAHEMKIQQLSGSAKE